MGHSSAMLEGGQSTKAGCLHFKDQQNTTNLQSKLKYAPFVLVGAENFIANMLYLQVTHSSEVLAMNYMTEENNVICTYASLEHCNKLF